MEEWSWTVPTDAPEEAGESRLSDINDKYTYDRRAFSINKE